MKTKFLPVMARSRKNKQARKNNHNKWNKREKVCQILIKMMTKMNNDRAKNKKILTNKKMNENNKMETKTMKIRMEKKKGLRTMNLIIKMMN